MVTHVPFIGRAKEIKAIAQIIARPDGPYIVCIGGAGGIGKSRLLNEVCNAQPSAAKNSRTPRILDFDDLASSTEENVRHKISQIVRPGAFNGYFVAEKDYQKIQNSNVSAEAVREFKKKVDDAFVDCFNSAAARKRKILYFDTTDNLKEDHEVKKNLLSIVPRLQNTVVLLAGRNAHDLYKSFKNRVAVGKALLMELQPFSQEESQLYLKEKAKIRHVRIEDGLAEKLIFLAEGKPILLDLAVDWRARGISLDWVTDANISDLEELKGQKKKQRLSEFQRHLVDHVRDLKAPMDRLILMMAHVYPIDLEMLKTIANSVTDIQSLFEEAKGYSFIKTLPDGSLSLHDVMRDMVNEYVWPLVPKEEDRRNWYSQNALGYFRKAIERLAVQIVDLEKQADQTQMKADQQVALLAESEGKRQKLWVLKEQLLRHALIANIDEGIETFAQTYEDASVDSRVTLRPNFIKLVEEKKSSLSETQARLFGYYRADQLFSQGDFDPARAITDELLQADSLAPDLRMKCLILRGNIRIRQGEVDEAIKDFEKAVEESKLTEQNVLVIKSTNALGWAHRLRGELAKALDYYQEARWLYHNADKQERNLLGADYGLILNNIAFILSDNNDTRKAAIDMANTAIIHWKKTGNELGLATGYAVQGICYYQTDHSELALDAFQKALDIFEPLGLKDWTAQVLSWRGALYHDINKAREAQKDLNRSLDIGPQHIRAMTLNRIGRVHMQRHNWNEAEKCIEESLALAKEIPDYKYWLGSISRLISIAAKKDQADKLDNFKRQLQECLKKIEKPDLNSEGIAYLGLAKLAFLHNSRRKIPTIVELLQTGIPYIVLYGSWARTDIVTRLSIIEEDFDRTDDEIIRKVGAIMSEFIYQKEKENINYSTALEIMFKWANWKGDKE